jgi:hypothetical protein
MTQTQEQFADGIPSSGGSNGEVSAVPVENHDRAESSVIPSLSSMLAPLVAGPRVLCRPNFGASITPNRAGVLGMVAVRPNE